MSLEQGVRASERRIGDLTYRIEGEGIRTQ